MRTKWQRIELWQATVERLVSERSAMWPELIAAERITDRSESMHASSAIYARMERLASRITMLNGKVQAVRATLSDLALACRAMVEEQGLPVCGCGWCGHVATHSWVRTAAELKKIQRKVKGTIIAGEPESIRCETHIPDWHIDRFRPLEHRAAQLAA
jgi:cobalamin biosynthesis Mg chelatase CobN